MDKILVIQIILISLIFLAVCILAIRNLVKICIYYNKQRKNVIDMNGRNKI